MRNLREGMFFSFLKFHYKIPGLHFHACFFGHFAKLMNAYLASVCESTFEIVLQVTECGGVSGHYNIIVAWYTDVCLITLGLQANT